MNEHRLHDVKNLFHWFDVEMSVAKVLHVKHVDHLISMWWHLTHTVIHDEQSEYALLNRLTISHLKVNGAAVDNWTPVFVSSKHGVTPYAVISDILSSDFVSANFISPGFTFDETIYCFFYVPLLSIKEAQNVVLRQPINQRVIFYFLFGFLVHFSLVIGQSFDNPFSPANFFVFAGLRIAFLGAWRESRTPTISNICFSHLPKFSLIFRQTVKIEILREVPWVSLLLLFLYTTLVNESR